MSNKINSGGKTKIKFRQWVIESGYSWLETITFFDDDHCDEYGYMMGLFHCKQCKTFEPYSVKTPPKWNCPFHKDGCFDESKEHQPHRYINTAPIPELNHLRNAFWRKHHHGDGRIILFERDI